MKPELCLVVTVGDGPRQLLVDVGMPDSEFGTAGLFDLALASLSRQAHDQLPVGRGAGCNRPFPKGKVELERLMLC